MSSLYDSLPITSCCRTVCEAMGVDCGDAPAPANEAVLAMCDRAFENIPKTAVFGQRFFFVRRTGRRRTSGRMLRRERRDIFRKMGENGRPHVRRRQNAVCPGRIVYRNTCIHKCVKPCIFSRIWHKTVIFTLLLVVRESIMKTEFLHRFNIVFFKTGSVNLWNSSRPVWPGPWNPAISW